MTYYLWRILCNFSISFINHYENPRYPQCTQITLRYRHGLKMSMFLSFTFLWPSPTVTPCLQIWPCVTGLGVKWRCCCRSSQSELWERAWRSSQTLPSTHLFASSWASVAWASLWHAFYSVRSKYLKLWIIYKSVIFYQLMFYVVLYVHQISNIV